MKSVLGVLLVVAAVEATNTALLNELICATNITFGDTNVPDETPGVLPVYQLKDTTINIRFPLTDDALASIYWVQIDTSTVLATGYQADRVTVVGTPLTWADLLAGSAISVQPSKFTGCEARGCDGFTLASVPFLALWNNTAIYFVFSTSLNFYGNSTTAAAAAAAGQFATFGVGTQTAPPTGSVLIGAVTASVNLTASAALRSAAFGGSSSSSSSTTLTTGAIVGIAVGAAAFVAIIIAACCFWSESRKRDYVRSDGSMPGRSQLSGYGGGYDYEGKHHHPSSSGMARLPVKIVQMI